MYFRSVKRNINDLFRNCAKQLWFPTEKQFLQCDSSYPIMNHTNINAVQVKQEKRRRHINFCIYVFRKHLIKSRKRKQSSGFVLWRLERTLIFLTASTCTESLSSILSMVSSIRMWCRCFSINFFSSSILSCFFTTRMVSGGEERRREISCLSFR